MEYPEKFFRRIFRDILSKFELDIEFRCLHPGQTEDSLRPRQFWAEDLAQVKELWPKLQELNSMCYDIHFTVVGRRRLSQGNKEHPLPEPPIVACFWADLDVGEGKPHKSLIDALRQIRALEPPPNIIVESGNGFHVYYILKKPRPMDHEKFVRMLNRLAIALRADNGAARATRLMRVPGTQNCKDVMNVKHTKIHFIRETGYHLSELEGAWSANVVVAKPAGQKEKSDGGHGPHWDLYSEHVANLISIGEGREALGNCPFHDDEHRSFCVNIESGLWICQACGAKGNLAQFCERLDIPLPEFAIRRFPRGRPVAPDQEWSAEEIFDAVHHELTRHIRFAHRWQAALVSVWAMGTYMHMNFPCYGHLWLNSPTTHSGKTKTLDVLSTICYRATEPQLTPTSAVVFRFPTSIGGTLILDEIDRLSPENQADILAVLNHYKRSGGVLRNVPDKKKHYKLEEFKVYCPKVIAGINALPQVLQDRCLKILLHRRRSGQEVHRFMPGTRQENQTLRDQLETWAARDAFRVLGAYYNPDHLGVPERIDDRLRDMLEPLFAICTALPKRVNQRLVEAAQRLAEARREVEAESDAVVRGIQTLNQNFPEGRDVWHLRSEMARDLFEGIPDVDTMPKVQALLRRFGFRSQTVRQGKAILRSYVINKRALDRLMERYGAEDAA